MPIADIFTVPQQNDTTIVKNGYSRNQYQKRNTRYFSPFSMKIFKRQMTKVTMFSSSVLLQNTELHVATCR